MKKTLFFMFISMSNFACDICNMNISLMPQDYKNTFSLMYRNRLTEGTYNVYGKIHKTERHAGPGSIVTSHYGKKITEIYNVYEIKGTIYLNKKISLTNSIPIINNIKFENDTKAFEIQKIGDPIIITNYTLINTRTISEREFNHKFNFGLGIKLPLGKTNISANGKKIETDMQPGTGSLDFLINSNYTIFIKDFGLLNNINYKLNSYSKYNGYKYGNSWNHTVTLFYLKKINNSLSIMPTVGVYYEYANNDKLNTDFISQSGGSINFGTIGLSLYIKKIRIEASYQKAIKNNMNGNTQIPTKNRLTAGISYYFN